MAQEGACCNAQMRWWWAQGGGSIGGDNWSVDTVQLEGGCLVGGVWIGHSWGRCLVGGAWIGHSCGGVPGGGNVDRAQL